MKLVLQVSKEDCVSFSGCYGGWDWARIQLKFSAAVVCIQVAGGSTRSLKLSPAGSLRGITRVRVLRDITSSRL